MKYNLSVPHIKISKTLVLVSAAVLFVLAILALGIVQYHQTAEAEANQKAVEASQAAATSRKLDVAQKQVAQLQDALKLSQSRTATVCQSFTAVAAKNRAVQVPAACKP